MQLVASPQYAKYIAKLIAEVQDRWCAVSTQNIRVLGTTLSVPADLETDWRLFMRLRNRYDTGDFRHTEDELRAMNRFMGWIVEVNEELCARQTRLEGVWGSQRRSPGGPSSPA